MDILLQASEVLIEQLLPQARKILTDYREKGDFAAEKKSERDFVTKADKEIEALLIDGIRKKFPDHHFLAEETAAVIDAAKLHTGFWWILDPVDGTTNFARGHNHVGISIALCAQGTVERAWVDAPFLGQTFFARKGDGAFENGRRMVVRPVDKLIDALLATGFPYARDDAAGLCETLTKVLVSAQDIRRNGAASLDCCWVASGRLDGYFETVQPWDMAAGGLIAREAGARFGHYGQRKGNFKSLPEDLHSENMLIATPGTFEAMQDVLCWREHR